MKRLFLLAVLMLVGSQACAAIATPAELVGIWATDDSVFQDHALMNGTGIYLDQDGIGGIVAGDGRGVTGARIVLTGYDPASHVLTLDVTNKGQVMGSVSVQFDPVKKTLSSAKDPKVYHRRFESFSADIRQGLGLEPRAGKSAK